MNGESHVMPQAVESGSASIAKVAVTSTTVRAPTPPTDAKTVPLVRIAHGRSGDKGDTSNIGIVIRDEKVWPWLRENLTAEIVAAHMAHLVKGEVMRYELPGIMALNFVLQRALGGGGMASLQSDPLGKCYAQMLLDMPLEVPVALLDIET